MFKLLAFLVIVALGDVTCKKLPSFINPCQRKLHLKQCLSANIEAVRPYLKKGIKALGIPPMGPLVLPLVKMETPTFSLTDRDLIMRGVEDFKLKDVDLNLDAGLFKITFDLPGLDVEANYSMEGSLFGLNVSGSGYGEGHIRDIRQTITLKGNRKNLDGKEYMNFDLEKFKMIQYGRKTYVYFRDLVRGNPELTETANQVLNARVNDFVYLVEPMFREAFGRLVESIVNTVFSRYSLDELFVD